MKKIITHPGQAHRDDFMSVCVLLHAVGMVPVERREPTLAELDDPEVLVVDVGGRHQPELGNFDHHQLPGDAPATCSLSLVLKSLNLYDAACGASTWVVFTEVLDSKGPGKAQELVGCASRDGFAATLSPVEAQLLLAWANGLVPIELLAQLGKQWVERWIDFDKKLLEMRNKCVVCHMAKLDYLVCDMPAEKVSPDLLERISQEWEQKHQLTISGTVSRDERGPGWCLYRRNDAPRLDFRRIIGRHGVTFVHANGFVAKTEDVPLAHAKQLFGEAVILPSRI